MMFNASFALIFITCLLGLIVVVDIAVCWPNQLSVEDLFNIKKPADKESTSRKLTSDESVCGYPSCPSLDSNKINVHIVAHTHDDVGWLKTVDQYYYGTNRRSSQVGVQHILDSVIPQLVMDITKRFIYVEMSFFTKWWREQDDQMKTIVRRLVDEGRLEFINGGWCMNDEATVTYHSTIEQMTLGLRFLNETFGQCGRPKVGWQIDPFGHSNEQASLFAQFGFDGMFFTRINYEDKRQRTGNKSLDIVWHGDRILSGQSGSIFTSIFRDGYDSPNGFCFDVLCLDDHLVDNENSFEFNIEYKAEIYINFLRDYAKSRLTNNILIPFGGDFQYSAAGQNFKNMDKLINYIRKSAKDINIFYSTPSCYQYAVHQMINNDGEKSQIRLPEKFDDFMPYDSSPTVWWSGYFSSRPSVKLTERETANLLQVARYVSMANLLKNDEKQWINEVREHESKCLLPIWEVLGDLQHHDAITGTEKQHVADDYVRRASIASTQCGTFIGELRRRKLNAYLKKSPSYDALKESGARFKLDPVFLEGTTLCPLLNISQCDPLEANVDTRRYTTPTPVGTRSSRKPDARTRRASATAAAQNNSKTNELPSELETKSVLLNVYNPMARAISQHDIRLPCNGRCDLDKVKIIHLSTNETMKLIRLPVPSGVGQLPFRDALTNYEVLFYANIPALGYTSFVIEDTNNEQIVDEEFDPSDSIVVTDEPHKTKIIRSRRVRSDYDDEKLAANYEYMSIYMNGFGNARARRETDSFQSHQNSDDRVIVKFDMSSGMIVGLKRVSDGSVLNITQKFGYYYPSNQGAPPGAYIFRPNEIEPHLMEKPILFKMFKRKNGALIEIHQKWADWLWQTIRVDAKKNYIEFDYLVGPIPITDFRGREVISRYITNMSNEGVFLTDSNARQLLARHRLRSKVPEQLGGSFFPVVSTIMMKSSINTTKCNRCSADALAILVDRAQAGASLNDGQLELLIHRRQLKDDNFGVSEALDEPGEDGRGLVSRGKHRLYLKFHDLVQEQQTVANKTVVKKIKPKLIKLPETPRGNLDYELSSYYNKITDTSKTPVTASSTYIIHDQIFNDLNQEARKHALKPVLTFDRLRVSANEFIEMVAPDGSAKVKTDLALLNTTLPRNVHLLTLQPWIEANKVLIRLENLDNPLTVHPFPDYDGYKSLLRTYRTASDYYELSSIDNCSDKLRPRVEVDLEYLIKRFKIVLLEELTLGANQYLKNSKRLDWTEESAEDESCRATFKPSSVKLAPREIRTFLAQLELL